jgi:hypothetical protein
MNQCVPFLRRGNGPFRVGVSTAAQTPDQATGTPSETSQGQSSGGSEAPTAQHGLIFAET